MISLIESNVPLGRELEDVFFNFFTRTHITHHGYIVEINHKNSQNGHTDLKEANLSYLKSMPFTYI